MQTLLESSFVEENTFVENGYAWYALYTRSRHEKKVAQLLDEREIENYLPTRKVMRHWSDRKKEIQIPLFSSYIFARFPIVDRRRVLSTPGVTSIVGRSIFSSCKVPDKDIQAIRLFSEHGLQIDPYPYLREGSRVYVRSGSFQGIEGFVVRKNSKHRLVISLDVLMQSISVEIDQACVELLD